MAELTHILQQIESGDPTAADELLPLVYTELRKLAAQKLAHERPGQTLQPTDLVHEAYLRLLGPTGSQHPWNSRGHFFAAAAEAMRRILVEIARRKGRIRHGGGRRRIELNDGGAVGMGDVAGLLALDEVLAKFEQEAPAQAQMVKLRYFAGLTVEEAAAAMDISPATAKRYWAYAKAWLYHALNAGE
jgi:RNA polymerase sigma factor (TIGR02999 family)